MKMADFEYHRPVTIDHALQLLGDFGGEAKVLSGGQSLVPVMAMRLATPAHVVDISRLPGLDHVRAIDDSLEIGALVRQAAAESNPLIRDHLPLVAAALPWIGHRAIRNRGTVCGSLAHADPAAELPATALALDATFVVRSTRGQRDIAAADFFRGYLSTSLADDELLVAVRIPTAAARAGVAVQEIARRHGDFALAGCAAQLSFDAEGLIAQSAFAFFGVADVPIRVSAAEQLLIGRRPSTNLLEQAAALVRDALHPPSDDHATSAYRRHVAGVLTTRSLIAATADAGVTLEVAA